MAVELRAFSPMDAGLLSEGAADPAIDELERLSAARALKDRIEDPWAFAIEADGVPVGGIGATRRHVPGIAEVGYWLVSSARGRGVARRALRAYVEWLFESSDVERIQATVELGNVASQRTLEHVGFAREGLLRRYASYGGPRRDVYLYALLKDEI